MKLGKRGKTTAATSLVVTIAMTAMMMLYAGGSPASSASAQQSARAAGSFTRVAHSPQGFAKSKIVGETAKGKRVTGSFTPLAFSKRNGHLRTRGLVSGVIHQGNGKTRTFSVMRTFRVRSMNGVTPGAARSAAGARATCRILHLVLAPLNLNLLGLRVHLDRVLLNIVAVSGAGQLLGNLLCAVAGLLDNGAPLGQILARLNRVLDRLLMGL
jgi:hypothetical protein